MCLARLLSKAPCDHGLRPNGKGAKSPPLWGGLELQITIDLSTEEAIALRRFCYGAGLPSLADAAVLALREHLMRVGEMELLPELDADSEVAGSA